MQGISPPSDTSNECGELALQPRTRREIINPQSAIDVADLDADRFDVADRARRKVDAQPQRRFDDPLVRMPIDELRRRDVAAFNRPTKVERQPRLRRLGWRRIHRRQKSSQRENNDHAPQSVRRWREKSHDGRLQSLGAPQPSSSRPDALTARPS
jgi:hypothetical protein